MRNRKNVTGTFRDRTFRAWIERITREESQEPWLVLELLTALVEVDGSLESRYTSYRLSRGGIDMIDIIVMKQS
jgi:hypothetical protein